jgi:uncharacterized NAD(P)/FAD-binding protein YdhS
MNTRNTKKDARFTVAIVGGGASGALTAYHLLRTQVPMRVLLIEPRAAIGLGLAYSTPSLRHLLNVPAGKISAIPGDPGHFLRWLQANYDADADAATFAPRSVFGRYLQSLLASVSGLERLAAEVVGYQARQQGAVLSLSDGSTLEADRVVLATGNFEPAPLPRIDPRAADSGLYAHNAWTPSTYAELDPDAPVTLIGSGLTAVDVLLRLRELGHRGAVTAVSRHGALPHRHAEYVPTHAPVIPAETPATSLAYLRALRAAIASGISWRAAVDSLRPVTNPLWLALSAREQLRFRRHLQHRWDIVRHRMAPPIADCIDAELAGGTLVLEQGSLAGIHAQAGMAVVTARTKHGLVAHRAARVINCTGPDMRYERVASPLLKSLFSQGLAVAGPLGGGFRCDEHGALLDREGRSSLILSNLGPGRLGTLLESIAMPEIRDQAFSLAERLAQEATPALGTVYRGAAVSAPSHAGPVS